jgi:hypothetical protein
MNNKPLAAQSLAALFQALDPSDALTTLKAVVSGEERGGGKEGNFKQL